MQNRTKDIRAAVSVIAQGVRRYGELSDAMDAGQKLSEAEQLEFTKFPTNEMTTGVEFIIGNLLIDIHTIALAHAPAMERDTKRYNDKKDFGD